MRAGAHAKAVAAAMTWQTAIPVTAEARGIPAAG
jgi:hypothetical protein